MSEALPTSAEDRNGGIARAASIIALGGIVSRGLGLIRETVIADLFGASGLVSVFRVASVVPTMIYDLLIGGMLSAALVPVFSQVAEQEGDDALWLLFSRVLSLVAVVLAALVLLVEIFASQLAWLLGGGFTPDLQAALVQMIRIIAPAILFFGLSGIVTGLLYARKQFTYPAFGAAVFNLGIIVTAPLLAGRLDAFSLAVGVLVGSVLQLLIQAPGLRGVRISFGLSLSDPWLKRILALYLPIALGLVVSNAQIALDRRLASGTGESSVAWMAAATTLIQLPHGLVAVAISLAVLPTLSRFSAAGDEDGFRDTLGQGLRLVLVLIIPATLGLLVLGQSLVMLLFEHGKFTSNDTYMVTWALRCYLVGLVFATVDWPLNYAFYARQNTLTPALVGIFSVVVYTGVALALLKPLGMLGLVLADSAKHISHAVVMLVLTRRHMGRFTGMRLGQTAVKSLAAAAVMAGVMALILVSMSPIVSEMLGTGLAGELTIVVVTGGVGAVTYVALASLLRVGEIRVLRDQVRRRLRGSNLDS